MLSINSIFVLYIIIYFSLHDLYFHIISTNTSICNSKIVIDASIKQLMLSINSISWPLERSLWSQGTSHFELWGNKGGGVFSRICVDCIRLTLEWEDLSTSTLIQILRYWYRMQSWYITGIPVKSRPLWTNLYFLGGVLNWNTPDSSWTSGVENNKQLFW